MSTTGVTNTPSADDVRLILRDLLKVIKVVWMYPPDNPLPQSMRQSFAEKLTDLVSSLHGIDLHVQKTRLLWQGEPVFEDSAKEDALAALFFNAGITEFHFDAGLTWDHVFTLLDIIRRHQNREPDAADLASSIWEANISCFRLKTIEDKQLEEYDPDFQIIEFSAASETGEILNDSSAIRNTEMYKSVFVGMEYQEESSDERSEVQGATLDDEGDDDIFPAGTDTAGLSVFTAGLAGEEASEIATAEKAMGYDDLRAVALPKVSASRLFLSETQLSEEESEEVRTLLSADSEFEMYESTLELLKELLHQEDDLSGFNEAVTICEKHVSSFLTVGRFAQAADLVAYAGMLGERIKKERPQWAERLRQMKVTIGSRDRMQALTFALNEHPHATGEQLTRYLSLLGPEALASSAEMLPTLLHESHANALVSYLAERGRENVTIISRGITDKRPYVVKNTVTVLARVGTDEALASLRKVIDHPEVEIRLELAKSLTDCPSDSALEILCKCTYDSDAEVRRAAIQAIVARRGVPAFEAITDLIGDDRFESLGPDDQKDLLIAYSTLGGDHALDYLSKLIQRKSLLGDNKITVLREAAFEALVYNASEASEKLLLKLTGSWRPEIKRRANEILKRRREFVYGGNHD